MLLVRECETFVVPFVSESLGSFMYVELLLMPRSCNNALTMGNIVGRQAEMRPADISISVQTTVGARVYVGSFAS